MNNPKIAVGYIRVSTTGQAEEGVSLEAQKAKIAAWAELNGYTLAAVHCDAGLSGKRADNRPELQSALDAACKGKAALVVYSLSRLARSTADAISIGVRLDKAGADLVSVSEKIDTTSAMGKFVFTLMAGLAQLERDQTAERTTMALAHKASKGERISGELPYGMRLAADGVHLEADPAERAVIAEIVRLRAEGMSYRSMAADLEARGLLPRSGGRWFPQMIKNVLSRAGVAA